MGARSFAGVTEGSCVGRAWRQPEAAGDEWTSRVAAVFGVCYNRNIFKDPFGHHY